MEDQVAKDAAAKQRVISHMNADHHDSVVRYLEHYHKQSSWTAYSAKITDVTLSEVTFQTSAGTFTTPFTPPMTSFREARERLVDMDKECVQALGRSDISIREWLAPKGGQRIAYLTMIAIYVTFSRRSSFAPTNLAALMMPATFRDVCYFIQPYFIPIILAIHVAEAIYMALGRLRRHNVNVKSLVFWQWVGDVILVGFGALQRFDLLVEQKRAAKAKQKH